MAVMNCSYVFVVMLLSAINWNIHIVASTNNADDPQILLKSSLFSEVCGRRPSHRIIGGRNASPLDWPWLVTLRTAWRSAFCGGTLITSRHVLTAAHCLEPFRRKIFSQTLLVVPGIHERLDGSDLSLGVESFTMHPQYGVGKLFSNDIGIITLSKPIESFMPVCLPHPSKPLIELNIHTDIPYLESTAPPSNEVFNDTGSSSNHSTEVRENTTTTSGNIDYYSDIEEFVFGEYDGLEEQYQLHKTIISRFETEEEHEGVVLGWGRLKEYGRLSDSLQQAEIFILNQTFCEKAYGREFDPVQMICGGTLEGGVDTCQGDSGGPFLLRDGNGTWSQIGIVSFGFGCGSPDFPGVYTNVSNYISWIVRTVGVS